MKKIILAAAGALLAVASVASAADLPMKALPPVALPPPSWTGFYIGGNIGYLVQHDESGLTNFTQPAATISNPAFSTAERNTLESSAVKAERSTGLYAARTRPASMREKSSSVLTSLSSR